MRKRSRLAAANSKSILVLALLVVVIAGYWGFRFFANEDAPADLPSVYELYCSKCVEVIEVPAAEARGRPRQNRKVLCPQCGTFSANWGDAPNESGGAMSP